MATKKKAKQGKKGKMKAKPAPAAKAAAKAGPSVAAVMDQMLQEGTTLDALIQRVTAMGGTRGRVVGHLWHRKAKLKARIVESKDGTLKWNSAGR